jgi:hypothetical protein
MSTLQTDREADLDAHARIGADPEVVRYEAFPLYHQEIDMRVRQTNWKNGLLLLGVLVLGLWQAAPARIMSTTPSRCGTTGRTTTRWGRPRLRADAWRISGTVSS